MPSTYKKPTKKQVEVFEYLWQRIKQVTPATLSRMSYNKRVELYKDFRQEVQNAKYENEITITQYNKLNSRLDVWATWIVEMPLKRQTNHRSYY